MRLFFKIVLDICRWKQYWKEFLILLRKSGPMHYSFGKYFVIVSLIIELCNFFKFYYGIRFNTLTDFLQSGMEDDPFFMPGHLSRADANKGFTKK